MGSVHGMTSATGSQGPEGTVGCCTNASEPVVYGCGLQQRLTADTEPRRDAEVHQEGLNIRRTLLAVLLRLHVHIACWLHVCMVKRDALEASVEG